MIDINDIKAGDRVKVRYRGMVSEDWMTVAHEYNDRANSLAVYPLDQRLAYVDVLDHKPAVAASAVDLIAAIERKHFRTEHDTGANLDILRFWNMVRSRAGLPCLGLSDLTTSAEYTDRTRDAISERDYPLMPRDHETITSYGVLSGGVATVVHER